MSAYLGASYQVDGMAASARLEARDSTSGERLVVVLGGAREITKTLSFSAASRYQKEQLHDQANREQTDVRVGAAWRPRGEGLIVLNRFDLGHVKEDGVQDRTKVVNNLAANAMLSDQTQVSMVHGVKHVKTNFKGTSASGWTHLVGGGSASRHHQEDRCRLPGHLDLWRGEPDGCLVVRSKYWIQPAEEHLDECWLERCRIRGCRLPRRPDTSSRVHISNFVQNSIRTRCAAWSSASAWAPTNLGLTRGHERRT